MPRSYAPGLEPIPGYRLRKFLGRGGFGEVWEAVAPGGTPCAVKIINLKDRQGLKEFRAIRLIKGIRHPHLTALYAFWIKDERSHIMDASSGREGSANLRAQAVTLTLAMGLGSMDLLSRL